MISYKYMQRELKRIPKLMKQHIKERNFEEVIRDDQTLWTLKWILETNDDD